jgi:hypothetical protein
MSDQGKMALLGGAAIAIAMLECPLWVINGSRGAFPMLPLFPKQQTSPRAVGMSALCHKRMQRSQARSQE